MLHVLLFLVCVSQMQCCGWLGSEDWKANPMIKNSSVDLYSCSCHNASLPPFSVADSGFCQASSNDLPIYETVWEILVIH